MNAPHETPIMKKQTVNARVRLKVTTCLYLKPNKRARSLSTLIAVDIEMDITHNAGIAGNKNCVVAVVENIPVHLYHPRRSKENSSEKWLRNKADAEISDCQSSKQEFCWWMKRRLFMKSNKYQSIAQCCGDGKKNVEGWNKYIRACWPSWSSCVIHLNCVVFAPCRKVRHCSWWSVLLQFT